MASTMTQPIPDVPMNRQTVFMTDRTFRCLSEIADQQKRNGGCSVEKIGPLIERLLRDHPEVIAAKKRLKIREWDHRPNNGRKRKLPMKTQK